MPGGMQAANDAEIPARALHGDRTIVSANPGSGAIFVARQSGQPPFILSCGELS